MGVGWGGVDVGGGEKGIKTATILNTIICDGFDTFLNGRNLGMLGKSRGWWDGGWRME